MKMDISSKIWQKFVKYNIINADKYEKIAFLTKCENKKKNK